MERYERGLKILDRIHMRNLKKNWRV